MRSRLVIVVLAVLTLAHCSSARVSVDEAEEAFVAAFSGAYIGSFVAQLGREIDGVMLDSETDEMLFDEFDISALGTQYSTISGSATTTAESLLGTFELSEGPVQTLSFELTVDQMRAESIEAVVLANGDEVEIAVEMAGSQLIPPE